MEPLSKSDAERGSALYDLERYLFSTVGPKFARTGQLSAFDFFCIVIWKSNRSKSRAASRLLDVSHAKTLDEAVAELARQLRAAPGPRERFDVVLDGWGFQLPIGSAILTVLWPDEFTIYDYRVCESLNDRGFGDHSRLSSVQHAHRRWTGYSEFVAAVKAAAPNDLPLRDADRALWGLSFAEGLNKDLERWSQIQDPR